jgi:hypothetical protein
MGQFILEIAEAFCLLKINVSFSIVLYSKGTNS